MGIAPAHLSAYLWWHAEGWLKPGASLLDLGAQELFCGDNPAALNHFIATFGGQPYPDDELARVANRSFAGEAMERAGFRYTSIDYKDYPYAVRLDLNHDALPKQHHGRYDVVTNHGTSEHILNQWNFFQTMHDAAAVGAIMYHSVPFCGEFEHGIMHYNAKFWRALSEANGYVNIHTAISVGDGLRTLPTSFLDQLDIQPPSKFDALAMPSAWMVVVLRKTKDVPFAGLIDPAFR
jgi:hypothetical protein